MIRVCWATANPNAGERGAWDMGIVEELTAGPEFEHRIPDLIEQKQWTGEVVARALQSSWGNEGAVVIVAGQHNAKPEYANAIFRLVASLPWSLVIVTSDEEALFPLDGLPYGPRYAVWTQYHDRGMDRVIPIGAPPDTPTMRDDVPRDLAISFVGQNTHARREELLDTIKTMAVTSGNGNIAWLATTGFRQGLDRDEYLATLARTRIAPCPSGPHSLDSFRLYEALAAGCLPVIELLTPRGYEGGFWLKLFGASCPLPVVGSWTDLPKLVEALEWPDRRDEVLRWFQGYREDLEIDFANTIRRLRES